MKQAMNKLGEILKERKITIEKAAELTGISQGGMIHLVYHQDNLKEVKLDTMLKLCIGLNVKVVDLFPEEEKDTILRLSRKSRKKKK